MSPRVPLLLGTLLVPLAGCRHAGPSDAPRAKAAAAPAASCEDRFFIHRFDQQNVDPTGTLDLARLRAASLAAIKASVADLQACGARVTLGNLMALLFYEGAFRVAAFNTRCKENSYNRVESACDDVAEALYSYQFGIGAIHTSNFHPCKGGAHTRGMRQRFHERAAAAGFSVDPALVTPALLARFRTVCPAAEPGAVDYYILASHEAFDVPRDGGGNHLAAFGRFPFFTPAVSLDLTFAGLTARCAGIGSDRDAIAIFGGGDRRYATAERQDQITAAFQKFKAAGCQ